MANAKITLETTFGNVYCPVCERELNLKITLEDLPLFCCQRLSTEENDIPFQNPGLFVPKFEDNANLFRDYWKEVGFLK